MKRWLPWVLKVGLSATVIWYLAGTVDLAAVWTQGSAVTGDWLAVATLLMLVQVAVGAVRWHAVMTALGQSLGALRTMQIYYIGVFFNLALPSSVGGDAVRMWKARRAGLPLAGAVNSVMLERLATVLALVGLVAATQPLLLARLEDMPGTWVFPLLSLLGVAGVAVLMVLDRLPAALARWSLVRGLAHLAHDTRRLFLAPRHMAWTMVLAVLGHVNLSLAVYALALGLGLGVDALDCIVLVPPVVLITTLPISIAGWGVREGAMVAAFGFVGVAPEAALVLSILFGLLTVVTSLPGGAVWLLSDDRHLPARGVSP